MVEKELPVKSEVKEQALMVIDDVGFIKPKDISEFYRLAQMLQKSGMVPARFKTAEQTMAGMQFALELGLKPLSGLKNIAIIQGSPCLYGDGPLSLVMSSGHLKDINEYFIDADNKKICMENNNLNADIFGAVCIVRRKGVDTAMESVFTIDQAKTAGLLKNPVWGKFKGRMLKYRARSQALKDLFPDCIGGIAQMEYNFNESESKQSARKAELKSDLI